MDHSLRTAALSYSQWLPNIYKAKQIGLPRVSLVEILMSSLRDCQAIRIDYVCKV